MIKKTLSVLLIFVGLSNANANESVEKEVNNFTVSVECVNECFDLLSTTENFKREYVNQCLLTCGVSDLDLLDRIVWQDGEIDRLQNEVNKMKTNKQLGKPFICVPKNL